MSNAEDCEQYNTDNNCCVCRNREWYRLYEDYKKLEAENKKLKLDLIEARAHGDYLNNSALSETLKIVSEQCDQFKAENEELKKKIESCVCSTDCYNYQEADKYEQALKEIKEIACVNPVNTCWTSLNLCDKCEEKEDCEMQSPFAKLKQILEKCEVVDEK